MNEKSENDVMAQVSAQELWKHTEYIAAEVRLSGSEGEARAVRYFEEVMGGLGLDVEIIHHDAYISLPQGAELSILSPETKSVPCITHSFSTATGPGGVESELSTMDGEARPGSIFMMEGLASPGNVEMGQNAGAGGMVFINSGDVPREFIITPVWGHPTPDSASRIPSIPVVTVNGENGEYLKGLCEKGSVRVRMVTDTWTGWKELPLPVAHLRGERRSRKSSS